jgi:HEAT repeat protein
VPTAPTSARGRRRDAARELLARFDLDAVARWAEVEPQAAVVLQSLLFDPDELVAWRAVEALGRVAAALAREGAEPARELVRRALWLMNDESGGLLWNGPQVIGAVLANVPALCRDLGAVLASFLEEEPFRAGTRWGLWRISGAAPEVVREAASQLGASFSDPDPAVRGLAALALRGAGAAVPDLAGDGAAFALFDFRTGELRRFTVAEAARPAR